MISLVVIGAGGYGRHALDIIEAVNFQSSRSDRFEVLGVLDDDPSVENLDRLERRGYKHLGTISQWLEQGNDANYVIGIGDPDTKVWIASLFDQYSLRSPVLVHPDATIHSVVELGDGTLVSAGARIGTNSRLGRHVQVNYNATIGHDAIIGAYSSIYPGANIAGSVHTGRGCLIGSGAQVLQQLNVGANSTIAAAACVTKDIPENCTVMGVPAEIRSVKPR